MIVRRTAPPKRRDKMAVHHSSEVQNWRTPKEFFKLLDARYKFTCDMAASKVNTLCPKFFDEGANSLEQDWSRHVGFLNPPYKGIKRWTQKASQTPWFGEAAYPRALLVMLVPARVDTRWWHDARPDCVTVLLKGRLKFRVPTKPKASAAPFPSMLLIFGEETRRLGVITTWDWKEEEYPV